VVKISNIVCIAECRLRGKIDSNDCVAAFLEERLNMGPNFILSAEVCAAGLILFLFSGAVFSFLRGWHTNFNYALLFELLLSKQVPRFYKSLSHALWLLNCYKSAPDGACRLIIKRKVTSLDLG